MKQILYICLFLYPLWSLAATSLFTIQEKSLIQDEERIKRTPISFDKDQLNRYKEQPEFDYAQETEDTWWIQLKRYLKLQLNSLMNWVFGDIPTGGFLLFLLQVLPYVIILGMLLMLIWLFHRMNPEGILLKTPRQEHVWLDEEEEIVQRRNINSLIEKALADKDYKSAIRYQYLLVLQILNQQEIINYQSAKTNEEYAREINSEPLRAAFRQLSRIYDYTWYGSFAASQETFKKMNQDLQQVIQLSRSRHEQQ